MTDRQLGVLRLLCGGLTNTEIAEQLVLSVRTVDNHVSAVFGRLAVRNRKEAAAAARTIGITSDSQNRQVAPWERRSTDDTDAGPVAETR
nr:LuxR C-terminal-related transcriptional regulator [Kribbella albertanoniae]